MKHRAMLICHDGENAEKAGIGGSGGSGGAVGGGGLAGARLEEADEVLRIFEAQTACYFGYAEALVAKQLLGCGDEVVGNEILGCATRFHSHKFTEIAA